MNMKSFATCAITAACMLSIAGCGGSSSGGDRPPAAPSDHTVGGSVFGLHGTLVLEINGSDPTTLGTDGTFVFSGALNSGSSYSVTVRNQPADQTCTVGNGSGAIAAADVTNVTVNCSTITRVVGGTVYGLTSSESVVLQNNSGDDLAVAGNGNFSFATPVAQSGAYSVTVLTQPASQICSVANGSGTAGAADIADVEVTCALRGHSVGGTVSGLSGTVVLENNGADNISVSNDGVFAFAAPVTEGATYNVSVLSQPIAQICVVTNGVGTMGATDVSNVGLSCTTNTTTLSASASDLALSVTGLTEYGVIGAPSSGLARVVTIANTGSDPAFNVAVTYPTWPAGTSSSTTCGSMLAAGSSCTVTVTPGNTASSDGTNPCSSGTAPIPGVIQVGSDNTASVSSNISVLSYGCIYQGGYVYAFDDTAPTTQSVGGKVAATTDQSNAVFWSTDGNNVASAEIIYGISQTSTTVSPNPSSGQVTGQTGCNGAIDGACNTNNVYVYYVNNAANAPISSSQYAAGLCKQTIAGYSDWSLPALCELGYGQTFCGTAGTPTLQNMQSNMVDFNGLNLLAGEYWSSTGYQSLPQLFGWVHAFGAPGSQYSQARNVTRAVRCSRSLSL